MSNAPRTNRTHINLRYLPYDHPTRNKLLVDVGAEFKHSAWAEFKPITMDGGKLNDNTYNDLPRGWQDFYEWRVPNPEAA